MRSHSVNIIQTISLRPVKHLVSVTEAQCVYCQVRSDYTYIHFKLQSRTHSYVGLQTTFILPLSLSYTQGGILAIIGA
jgi:hypothetical protein